MTATLFIGGPWDGRLVEHTLLSPTFRVMEHRPVITDYALNMRSRQPAREVVYLRTTLMGHVFMVEQTKLDRGMWGRIGPGDFVLDQLCQGYRRPSFLSDDA